MVVKKINALCMACVLLCHIVYARMLPVVHYDEAQAYIMLPINISTHQSDFFAMAKKVVAALKNDQVVITVKGYVTPSSTLRDKAHTQYIAQQLARYLNERTPHAQITTSVVVSVPEEHLLPAWQMSTAKTIPSGYIAIIVTPLDM